jgi:hypothetical protein
MIEVMFNVLQATSGEIVETQNTVSARQERVHEMRADKSCRAGNEPGGGSTVARFVSEGLFPHILG